MNGLQEHTGLRRFSFVGYRSMRRYMNPIANASSEKGDTSRVAAVFGIIGAVNIPIINRSVIWWESQHQKASITLGGSSIDQAYLVPLFVSVAGFSLLFGALVLRLQLNCVQNCSQQVHLVCTSTP